MSFISFSYLIFMDGTSSKVLNSSGENRHLCLVSDLREKGFSLYQLKLC